MNVVFGQQYPDEAVGRGVKQVGEESSEEVRTEGMGQRVSHSEEGLVSPEGESILSRLEITDL